MEHRALSPLEVAMNKRIRKKRVRQMLLVELAILFPQQEDALAWLDTPLDQFEGRTPRDTINAGEIERVTLLLDELNAAKA
jgi:uncharacterized protein (DUF2384 family)